jgi:hypothetical protein
MSKQRKWFWFSISLLSILALLLLMRRERQPSPGFTGTNGPANNIEHRSFAEEQPPETQAPPQPPATIAQNTNVMQEVRDPTEKIKPVSDTEVSMWQSPILYFGKIVDESNQPISGVQVSYRANALNEARIEVENSGTVISDGRGAFKINGVRGIGLMLELSHPNYYAYAENSTGFDKRSLPQKGYFSDNEESAELFQMHSKGNPVPVIARGGGFHAPSDGSIAMFPLRGSARSEILGQLQIQGRNGLRSEATPYDWKVELTLTDGGIAESTNYFDFVAPEAGYSNRASFEVSGSEMKRKTYFLKLPSGYIRFKLEVIMGKDMFVSGDYYFNPDGSRNLEPSKEIRPNQ